MTKPSIYGEGGGGGKSELEVTGTILDFPDKGHDTDFELSYMCHP